MHALYWAIIIFYILYKISIASKINICVENLSLINVIPLYVAIYLSMFVDALKISLLNLRYVHNLIRLIIETLATTHVDLSATTKTKELINLSI